MSDNFRIALLQGLDEKVTTQQRILKQTALSWSDIKSTWVLQCDKCDGYHLGECDVVTIDSTCRDVVEKLLEAGNE